MDNFEYSIQLNDRDWAEFFLASEECDLAPAALATAEEQCLSDIEQGDGVLARDCRASASEQIAASVGNEPGPGTGSSAPRGVSGDTSLCRPASGHLSLPELLSGSEDEADLGSVGRFLCKSDKPGCSSPAPMPSAQGRQPSRPPTAPRATPAGGMAESSPGQDTAREAAAAAPQPASEKGAASSRQAMEPPSHPAGTRTPEHGRDAGGEQPQGSPVAAQPGNPMKSSSPAATPEGSARKNPSGASRSESGLRGPPRDHPASPAPENAPRAPGCPAREETSGERAAAEPSSPAGSPEVVRPKVPGQLRKSRKQRGASAAEAAQGDREPVGAAAQGAGTPVKTPLSSPLSSRKSKGKEKAAKPALVKMGSEESGESKRLMSVPSTDEGDPATSASPKQKVKELGTQPAGKAKATKLSKPGQAGGLGIRDNVPVIPASGAAAPPGETCREAPQKSLQPKSLVVSGGDAAEGTPPGEMCQEAPQKSLHPQSMVTSGGVAAERTPLGEVCHEAPQKPLHPKSLVASGGVAAAGAPLGEVCQEAPQKPLHPKSMVASGGVAAEGACGETAAETPGEPRPLCFASGASERADSLDVTWPEMYDYLFCDSQEEEEGMGNSVEREKTPLEREISWPELYEYFFNEPEGKRKKVQSKERKRKKFSSMDHAQLQSEDPDSAPVKGSLVVSVPEVYEHFFLDRSRNRAGWRGIFSIAPASEVKKAVGALKSLLQRPMHLVRGQAPAPQPLLRRGSGEKLSLVPLPPLGRGQMQPEGLDMALALPGGPEAPLTLTHKDMCLVFCAFASWAVKTSDLQAPDAWKTMFLASFGTLSAIRYFRRQVREGYPRT